uniref:TRAP transporter substrate-binding protein n=1 Tax=Marinobacterium profundum TaxID=1714300 RepID=UPI0009EB4035|nr:TRAP transporter substrate-binding protein [Marinobacterium profundum]
MKNKIMHTLVLGFAGTALTLSAAQLQAEELIFGIGAPQGSLQYKTAERFTEIANARMKNEGLDYSIALFGDAQLGKDKALLQKLKLGTVHFSQPSSIMSTVSDKFALFDMPFLVKDREHLAKIEKEVFWPQIAPSAEAKGYTVLSLWENGFRHITNNTQAINTPADLAGVKLRTPNSTWRVNMFREWGSNPTPMSFSEVFVALQTGVIDGQENPLTNIYSAKLQEVQTYLSLTNHVYTPSYLVAGKNTWAKLPAAVKTAIKESGDQVKPWMYEQADKSEVELLDKLTAGGMKVNKADREAFVSASKPIYITFASQVDGGEAMLNTVLQLAN